MKQLNLSVTVRDQNGSSASQRLRKGGRIPAVLYGPNGTRNLSIDGAEFRKLWKQVSGRTAVIELIEEGIDPAISIIQAAQRNPRTDEFLHVDFKEIMRGHEMFATVSVRVIGEPFGVRNEGAVLEAHRHDVELRCLPRHLPEMIEIDVTDMKAGDSLKIKDLPVLEGVTYITDEEVTVVTCAIEKVEEEAEEEAEAEPVVADAAAKGKAKPKGK